MLEELHFFPGLVLLLVGLGLQYFLVRRLPDSYRPQGLVRGGIVASTALLVSGYFLEFHWAARHLPVWWATWLQCASIVETMCLIGVSIALPLLQWGTRERALRFQ